MEQEKILQFKKLSLEDKLNTIYAMLLEATATSRDMADNALVSFTNAARMMGVSYQTVHNWVAKQQECDYEADGSRFMLSYANLKQIASQHNKFIDKSKAGITL